MDMNTRLGIADWIGYFIPLLLTVYAGNRFVPLLLTAVLSALMVIGLYFSPPGIEWHLAVVNRCLGIGVLWLIALLTYRQLNVEEEVRRINRALTTISNCNQVMVRAKTESALLQDICHVIVENGGYRFVWVGFAENDEKKSVRPAAFAGFEDGYLKLADISWADTERGRGPAGTAIRTGKMSVCRNTFTDPAFEPWRKEAIRRGYASCIMLPLSSDGKVFGALSIYSGEVQSFAAEEVKLLTELADDLAYGIQTLRNRIERAQMNQQIREQAQLIELAQDAITVRDLQGRILFWNKGAERIYGWTAKEAIGQEAGQFLQIGIFRYDQAKKAVLEKSNWQGELTSRTKGGAEVLIESHWTLVRDAQRNPKSILVISTDITEKKKLENQFYRTQRMESLGTLATGIAHDLNNILTPLLVSVQLLKEKIKDVEGHKLLERSEIYVQRGASLIKQVLSFGRGVEGEKISVEPARISREIEQIVRETFPKLVEFKLHCPADLWRIIGDPTQIHQVLLNLCLNARDAMPNGGRLNVDMQNVMLDEAITSTNPDIEEGAYVCISVTDTGVGIPAGIQDKIFEPFFTTKDAGKGTGMGLSTSLGIIKGHGGFINCYSEEGKGSTFKIYLPADAASVTSRVAPEKRISNSRKGKGEWVLVVDDEEAIREVVRKMLEKNGYRVVTAVNGVEAISIYKEKQKLIDAVITDMAMPVMDGAAAITSLKSINPAVKVIASSGLSIHENMDKAAAAGVSCFIPKPYTAETVLEKLAEILHE